MQLLDEVVVPVVCNDICPGPAAYSGVCWAVGDDHGEYTVAVRQGFFRPCLLVCSSTGAGCGGDSHDPSVASCSSPSCRRHPCRGAEAGSLVCLFMQTIVLPHLQFIDKVVYVPVGQVEQVVFLGPCTQVHGQG